jgi:hypothetical protein
LGFRPTDYLYELGRQAANMRTEVGQNKTMLDPLFAGGFLGVDSDIASGELRKHEFRTLSHHKVRICSRRFQLTLIQECERKLAILL